MQLRPDAVIKEYILTPEEFHNARILNALQYAYLQNLYAAALQEKIKQLVPKSNIDDREYLLQMGSIEGRLELIQELFVNHQQAITEVAAPAGSTGTEGNSTLDDLATRAAKHLTQGN